VVEAGGVDQLDFTRPHRPVEKVGVFPVGQHPDISGDAGIVKQVGGQGDNAFQQVVFNQLPSNLRFPRARVAGKQRGAVEDDGHPGALLILLHFGQHVLQEQQGAVGGARGAGPKTAVKAQLPDFLIDKLFILLPVHAEGGIHQGKAHSGIFVAVSREGVAPARRYFPYAL